MSNACTRLVEILNKINNQPAFNKVGETWKVIFDLKDTPEFEVYRKDMEFRKLVYDARLEAIEYGDINKNPWIKHFDKLANILKNISLKSKLNEFENLDTIIIGLESCAFTLNTLYQEPEVDQELLNGFVEELDEIHQLAYELNIPNDLKKYLLDNMHSMKKAILDYNITGSTEMRKAMEATVGQICLNHEALEQTKEGAAFVSTLIGLMGKINTLFSFYNNVRLLSSGAVDLIKNLF